MRACRWLILAGLVALSSACQLPPLAELVPDSTCPRDAKVGETDIFVLTARAARCHSAAPHFGPYRQIQGLGYGRSPTEGQFPHGLAPTMLVDRDVWDRELARRVRDHGAPVIYIHGFNNNEDEAVRTARAIHSLLWPGRPVIAVTWPSYARVTAVGWDEANNEWAREALSASIADIVRRYKGTILIAHSMGNRILLDLFLNHPQAAADVANVVAAAPDVDEDQFMRHMLPGHSLGIPVTIYASTRDQALASSWMWHGMRRAGDLSAGAHNPRILIRYTDLDPSVTVVDLSRVKDDPFGHSDFIRSVSGAADLCRILNGERSQGRSQLQGQYFQLAEKDYGDATCWTSSRLAVRIDRGKERLPAPARQ